MFTYPIRAKKNKLYGPPTWSVNLSDPPGMKTKNQSIASVLGLVKNYYFLLQLRIQSYHTGCDTCRDVRWQGIVTQAVERRILEARMGGQLFPWLRRSWSWGMWLPW